MVPAPDRRPPVEPEIALVRTISKGRSRGRPPSRRQIASWSALPAGATAAAALAVGLLAAAACAPPDEEILSRREAERRAEIERALVAYLPDLAEAYATGDVAALRVWAVDRLVAQIQRRIAELGDQGLILDATFRELTVEELVNWEAFSLVTTLEVWDLRYESLGTGVPVSERPGARSRVQYQVRKEEGRWRVFHRELVQDLSAEH
jgi:hypothetical protein